MMTRRAPHRSSRLTRLLCLPLPLLLILMGLPSATCAQGRGPLEGVRNLSLLSAQQGSECVKDDPREVCRLRAAVVAAQDQIDDFRKKLDAANAALDGLKLAVESAKTALAAVQIEREAYENTIKLSKSAIEQQQSLIATYQGAIKTLTELVGMVMARVKDLEKERDSANKRTAILGVILTAIGVLTSLKR